VQWLENLYHTIGSSPLFVSVGVLLLFVLLLSAVLKVARLALVAGLLMVAYIAYLQTSGGQVPQQVQTAKQVLEASVKDAGKALKENADSAAQAVREGSRAVGERLEQGFGQPASATQDRSLEVPVDRRRSPLASAAPPSSGQ
jgi:ABC-type multidrug transport system fused ATPase/permease subunit